MSFKDIKAKHGGSDARGTLNRAIRAEIPGAGLLLDARAAVQSESQRPNPRRHPAQIRAIREMARALDGILDTLRKAIIESYGVTEDHAHAETEQPKKETASKAVSSSDSLKSTPVKGDDRAGLSRNPPLGFNPRPPQQATPAISLDALKPSSLGTGADNARWTPPAEIVALMGKVPDTKLHEMTGVSATLIREHRERLGIPAVPRGGRRPGAGRPPTNPPTRS
jgi:hypothetical protein